MDNSNRRIRSGSRTLVRQRVDQSIVHTQLTRLAADDEDIFQEVKVCLVFGAKSSREEQLKIIKALENSAAQPYIMETNPRSFKLKPVEYAQWLGKQ